jgi:hypothetical protein
MSHVCHDMPARKVAQDCQVGKASSGNLTPRPNRHVCQQVYYTPQSMCRPILGTNGNEMSELPPMGDEKHDYFNQIWHVKRYLKLSYIIQYALTHLCPLLAHFPYFEKIEQAYEITLLSVCLCIPPINFWTPEPIFMKLGTYITAPEPN